MSAPEVTSELWNGAERRTNDFGIPDGITERRTSYLQLLTPTSYVPTFQREYEPYTVRTFTEAEDMDAALMVQRMHGASYVQFRYLDESVLIDGRLPDELDHSRGDNITYLHATANPTMPDFSGEASGRLVDGSFDSLFVSDLHINEEYREYIRNLERQGRVIRELGAISLTADAKTLASFSIVRDVVQHSIRSGGNDILLGSQTAIALRGFKAMFGPKAVRTMGGSTTLQTGEDKSVRLTPVFSDTKTVLADVLDGIQSADSNEDERSRLAKSLAFLVDGLEESERPDRVSEYLADNSHE